MSGGGPPERDAFSGTGTWNAGGEILFSHAGGLSIVQAAGGHSTGVTTLDPARGETSHRFPHFLPDGRRFIYLIRSTMPEHQGIFLGSLESGVRVRLTDADSNAAYAEPGYLLFVREATLVAQRFDNRRARLSGEPLPLASSVVRGPTIRLAPFAVSADVLVYRTGGVANTQLVRINREGHRLGTVGPPGPYPANPALSPDGRQIAMALLDPQSGESDIWLFDIARSSHSRFTFHPGLELAPLWARDGRSILFASIRTGPGTSTSVACTTPHGTKRTASVR